MKKKTLHITLVSILILLAVFLRVINLAVLPLSMHIDEAGLGLNAWSLANYGTDRYGNFMPVCPSNFYGEQSAFYTYFCALFVKFFGLSIYTLRLPGVIMGMVTVIFGSLLMKEKWGNKGLYTGLTLLGILPYFIINSRFALDCNAMLGTLTIALYALAVLQKKIRENPEKKYYSAFLLVGCLFGFVLYTYIIAAIVIAVFCVLFGLYYLLYKKETPGLRFKQLLFMAGPIFIMVIPLLLVVCVNYFGLDPIKTPFFSIPKMAVNRTEEVTFSLSALPGKIKGLLHVFTSDGKYGSSDTYWTMFWWSPLFIGIGGVASIVNGLKEWKNKIVSLDICLLFVTFAQILMFILCGTHNYHINGIFIVLVYFCLNGIFTTIAFLKKKSLCIGFGVVLACLYTVTFIGFAKEYYFADTSAAFQVYDGVSNAVSLLDDEQKEKDIYVLSEVADFYFLSNPIPPEEFSAHCDELGYVKDYKNLHFYTPDTYESEHVYICNKGSGYAAILSDSNLSGHDYSVLETKHYLIFYME